MSHSLPLSAPLPAALPDLTPFIEPAVFGAMALIAVLSALVAATAGRIVHAALALMATFFGVAGLYFLLGADFLALAQIIVYVGGILILLVFGILLTGRTRGALGLEREPGIAGPAVAGGLLLLGLLVAIRATEWNPVPIPPPPRPTTPEIGRAFLDPEQYLVPFELASVLLLAALVGAAYLVRRRRPS
jgi:NADH:ubiquinone oxidoreductase subunit 6 (subunit J)